MSKILATAHVFGLTLTTRLRERVTRGLENGDVIEKVVITVGVLALAIFLVGVITNAVQNRAANIN